MIDHKVKLTIQRFLEPVYANQQKLCLDVEERMDQPISDLYRRVEALEQCVFDDSKAGLATKFDKMEDWISRIDSERLNNEGKI